jgi:hypothetical protein
MTDQTDNRNPDEIESDIERTRADFSSTIDAIENKLRPSQLVDQAVDYALQTTPGAFSANLVHSVRDNPMPVALIGVGIAWLMATGRHSDGRAPRSRQQRVVHHTVYYPDGEVAYYEGPPRIDHVQRRGGGGSSDSTMHRAQSKISETGHNLKDKASDVGHRIGETASSVSERTQQMGQRARNRLHESSENVQSQLSEIGHQSQEQYYRARNRFGQLLDEQPLVVGALGIAIGAALGTTLPSTRRENELMGSTRDNLVGRVKETAQEQADNVAQSAQRVAEVAKQEAARVGEVAKEEAGRVGEVAKEEAGRVKEDAKAQAASASSSVSDGSRTASKPGQKF